MPGVASPTVWEEEAVAAYERLVLRRDPDPVACHRLAIIYAGRGYAAEAREMLLLAASRDEAETELCLALLLVYADEPIARTDVPRITELLRQQPTWWALRTLEQLADRLDVPSVAESYGDAALRELWRTGPYLHDGRAVSLLDVLTTHNKADRHGRTSRLSKKQRADLLAFLLSL